MAISSGFEALCADQAGTTAIEYALLAALAAIAALSGIQAVGTTTGSMWEETVSAIVAALSGA